MFLFHLPFGTCTPIRWFAHEQRLRHMARGATVWGSGEASSQLAAKTRFDCDRPQHFHIENKKYDELESHRSNNNKSRKATTFVASFIATPIRGSGRGRGAHRLLMWAHDRYQFNRGLLRKSPSNFAALSAASLFTSPGTLNIYILYICIYLFINTPTNISTKCFKMFICIISPFSRKLWPAV